MIASALLPSWLILTLLILILASMKLSKQKIVQARNLSAQHNKPIKESDTHASALLYTLRPQITIRNYTLNKAN